MRRGKCHRKWNEGHREFPGLRGSIAELTRAHRGGLLGKGDVCHVLEEERALTK